MSKKFFTRNPLNCSPITCLLIVLDGAISCANIPNVISDVKVIEVESVLYLVSNSGVFGENKGYTLRKVVTVLNHPIPFSQVPF